MLGHGLHAGVEAIAARRMVLDLLRTGRLVVGRQALKVLFDLGGFDQGGQVLGAHQFAGVADRLARLQTSSKLEIFFLHRNPRQIIL